MARMILQMSEAVKGILYCHRFRVESREAVSVAPAARRNTELTSVVWCERVRSERREEEKREKRLVESVTSRRC